jgi:hypothetical protein
MPFFQQKSFLDPSWSIKPRFHFISGVQKKVHINRNRIPSSHVFIFESPKSLSNPNWSNKVLSKFLQLVVCNKEVIKHSWVQYWILLDWNTASKQISNFNIVLIAVHSSNKIQYCNQKCILTYYCMGYSYFFHRKNYINSKV